MWWNYYKKIDELTFECQDCKIQYSKADVQKLLVDIEEQHSGLESKCFEENTLFNVFNIESTFKNDVEDTIDLESFNKLSFEIYMNCDLSMSNKILKMINGHDVLVNFYFSDDCIVLQENADVSHIQNNCRITEQLVVPYDEVEYSIINASIIFLGKLQLLNLYLRGDTYTIIKPSIAMEKEYLKNHSNNKESKNFILIEEYEKILNVLEKHNVTRI